MNGASSTNLQKPDGTVKIKKKELIYTPTRPEKSGALCCVVVWTHFASHLIVFDELFVYGKFWLRFFNYSIFNPKFRAHLGFVQVERVWFRFKFSLISFWRHFLCVSTIPAHSWSSDESKKSFSPQWNPQLKFSAKERVDWVHCHIIIISFNFFFKHEIHSVSPFKQLYFFQLLIIFHLIAHNPYSVNILTTSFLFYISRIRADFRELNFFRLFLLSVSPTKNFLLMFFFYLFHSFAFYTLCVIS